MPDDTNELKGSCPNCGGNIWSHDSVLGGNPLPEYEEEDLFFCIRCRQLVSGKELIPF